MATLGTGMILAARVIGSSVWLAREFGERAAIGLSAVTSSGKCYPEGVTAGTAYTVPVGAAISFDGTTWTSIDGTWPTGKTWWMVRVAAAADYATPSVTVTPTLNGVDYPFTVITLPGAVQYLDEMLQSEIDAMLQSEIDLLQQTRP